jgi:hypothetical protein
MVEQKRRFGFRGTEAGDSDERAEPPRAGSYAFGRSARADRRKTDSAPLFLSESDQQADAEDDVRYPDESYQDDPYADAVDPYASEYSNPLRTYRRATVSFRILMAVLAASGIAMLFALFSSDATRNFIETAKASISSTAAVPPAAAEQESTQLSAQDIQLKDPTRMGAVAGPPADSSSLDFARVASAPTHDEINSAYQNALQNQAPAAAPQPAVTPQMAAPQVAALSPASQPVASPAMVQPSMVPQAATPPARRIDPDELAMLMKRAKDMLAVGDFPPARLLLRRAADAQEPNAALLLAQTYDPQVLGTRDVRNINADLAAARNWYQKAAQLGSAEAQRRLGQMQN